MPYTVHLLTIVTLLSHLFSTLAKSVSTSSILWTNKQWHFLGPFPVGKTEIDGNPLHALLKEMHSTNNTAAINYRSNTVPLFSELVEGGHITRWSPLPKETRRNEYVRVDLSRLTPTVNLQDLVRLSSSVTIQEFQGLISRKLTITKPGTYAIACHGLHTIEIDQHLFHADVYSSQQIYAVTYLDVGVHHVSSRIRGKGSASFRCSLSGPSRSVAVRLHSPPLQELPDVVQGKLLTPHLSVRVVNLGSAPITTWSFTTNNKHVRVTVPLSSQKMKCYSGQSLNLPLNIKVNTKRKKLPKGEKDQCLTFVIALNNKDNKQNPVVATVKITLRCRRQDQSQLMTYISHDGTVASAALLRPHHPTTCSQKGCPIILALSGVGVQPMNMADSFKYKDAPNDPDYIFGLPTAWVLAPERDGAHNFEGTGHHTAMSALLALTHVFPGQADASRVVYAGHSRGGHGALVFATHRPDRACGVFASNGWTRREYYADANPIFDHDVQLSHSDGNVIRRVFESSIIENDVGISAVNMVNVPTLLRTASDDQSVSPWFIRRFGRILQAYDKDTTTPTVELNEFTSGGKGHWWWNSKQTNDGGVMFDRKVRSFLTNALQECKSLGQKNIPDAFQTISLNPSTFTSRYGMRIEQFRVPFRLAKLDVVKKNHRDLGDELWHIKTTNVARFTIQKIVPSFRTLNAIVIDGQTIQLPPQSEDSKVDHPLLQFVRDKHQHTVYAELNGVNGVNGVNEELNEWTLATAGISKQERRPGTTGPMRQVFDRPFVIVPNATTLPLAIMLANSHFAGSKTTAPIFLPGDVDEAMKKKYNFIFIGSSKLRHEMVLNDLPAAFPIRINDTINGSSSIDSSGSSSSFQIHTCTFHAGDHVGLVFLAPTTTVGNDQQLALIIDATDRVDLVDLFRGSYSSNTPLTRAMFTNMYPDFMVTNGHAFRWKGYGGLHMSGYFNNKWGWDSAMSVVSSACER